MYRAAVIADLVFFSIGLLFGQPPQSRPEFEVASVKPAAGSSTRNIQIDSARVRFSNVTLLVLIHRAYSLEWYQEIRGPAWLRSASYDVVAKLPAGVPQSQIPLMLQSLLADRFRLKLHREKKELQVYALVVGKTGPKIHAVGSHDEIWNQKIGSVFHLSGKRSIGELVTKLNSASDVPILDMTGLKGFFDVDLSWALDIRNPDPTAPPLADALQQQLGLKLDPRKIQSDVLVVDHAEKVPLEGN